MRPHGRPCPRHSQHLVSCCDILFTSSTNSFQIRQHAHTGGRRSAMKNAIRIAAAASLLAAACAPAKAQDLEGTLKKIKDTGTFTIGHRDSSIPLSYL